MPFTLALSYTHLFCTGVLTIIIGMLLASVFPAILIFSHELIPPYPRKRGVRDVQLFMLRGVPNRFS